MNTLERTTVFSPDRVYRYTLWREWSDLLDQNPSFVQFIALNPSTADETINDPTIRRCIQFAKDWGYGALCMTNLFAYRATDPRVMKASPEPIGSENDDWLYAISSHASLIVCAWGKDGQHQHRGRDVAQWLSTIAIEKLCSLGRNADGTPRHPLYLPATTKPLPYP